MAEYAQASRSDFSAIADMRQDGSTLTFVVEANVKSRVARLAT